MSKKKSNVTQNKTLKATIWYLVCEFVLKGISFITMPIFTRMMTSEEIGSFSILASWISILSVIVTLNLIQSVFLAKYDFADRYDNFISAISMLGMFSAFICYIFTFPFRYQISAFLGIEEYSYNIMFIYLIFCQISGVVIAKYRANLEYKKSVILALCSTVVTSFIAVLLVVLCKDSLKGRIYGTYIPSVVINILLFIFVIYRKKSFKKEYIKYAMAICLPLIIHNLAGNIMNSSDRIMIGKLCSSEDAGFYGVAYTCAMFANVLRNAMDTAWTPWVFEKINANKTEEIKKASYFYLLSFLFICVGIIVLAPEVLFILGGKPYQKAVYVVPPVVAAYMFSMLYSLYAGVEHYYKKQKSFAIIASICALVNIILNLIFIPVWGYIAAAYTTLASTALECFLHYINVKRMGMTKVYNTKFNVTIALSSILVAAVSVITYRNNYVRYTLIFIVLLVALGVFIKKKQHIIDFVKNSANKRK